jgi:hypothetical protein
MIKYNLDNLGWYQFENMIQSLLKSSFSMAIESWGDRGDHGIDAFYEGKLDFPVKGKLQEGPFIFQVKFIEEANAAGAKPRSRIISAIKSELSKINERQGYFENGGVYTLFTNVSFSVKLREEIREILQGTLSNMQIILEGGQ